MFGYIRLKSLDLVCMKKLDNKVNIIPVIAKADTISKPELLRFKVRLRQFQCNISNINSYFVKTKIMGELAANGVQIYQFPVDDETVAEMNLSMNAHFPFAVCGSTDFIRVGNKMVRARQYPWGTVQGNFFFVTANHYSYVNQTVKTKLEI